MDIEPNEYELALRAREGDREALAELVERTRLRLFALAYVELPHYEDAQDAVAAALVQICRHVTELRKPESIRAWMHRIVRNETHRLRRGPGAPMASLEEVEARTEGADPSLLRLDIERALRRLPGNHAEAIRLFHLQGLSMDEVARHLGRSQGTVGSWLYRGRQQMAREIYMGAEHLLLGFLREGYGLAARVLVKLGADLERTRREVVAMRAERA
jgi:RNA polymerase sigma-70 factor (ECF subfamily)